MSAARNLAGLGNQNTFAVESVANEVGIASTAPSSTLDVRGEVRIGTAVQLGSAGVITATSFSGSGANLTGLATTETVRTDTLTVAGVSTFTGVSNFSAAVNVDATTDSTSTTTGALIVDGGVGIAKNVYIGAGLSVAGTLTYEDVTSVDSVGLITAKSGVNITGGQLQVGVAYSVGAAGVVTAAGFVGDLTGTVTGSGANLSAGTVPLTSLDLDGGTDIGAALADADLFIVDDAAGGTNRKSAASRIKTYVSDLTLTTAAQTNVTSVGTLTGLSVSGDVSIADKIVHTGDTDTALRFPAANTVSVETAGAEDMRIASGKVGIGTNEFGSGAKLRVGTNLLSRTQDFSDGGFLIMPTTGDTIATAQIMPLITAAGEGGSPHILRAGIAVESTSGRSGMDMLFLTRYAADGTALDATDDEKMRITDYGLVGIGTSSPQSELHVMESKSGGESHGSSQLTLERSGTNYLQFLTANDGTSGILFGDVADNDGTKIKYDHNTTNLLFETEAAERLRITANGAFQFSNGALTEKVNITAGKLSDNADIDLADGMVHYFTTQETTTSTPNIRVNGSTTLNSIMTAGDVVTVTVITTTAAAGYSAHMTIDSQTITEEWVGGSAPSAGGSNGLDIYVYTIICTHASNTGDSGFKVIANLTNAT